AKSLLIKAIGYKDADLQMPPKQKLSDRQIADFTQWVKMGAPWPGGESHANAQPTRPSGLQVTAADKKFWAFRPIHVAQPPPAVAVESQSAVSHITDIDRFILAKLHEKGLKPNSAASKRELIRRVYLDLMGLPPTPREVEAFLSDQSPNAYENLI